MGGNAEKSPLGLAARMRQSLNDTAHTTTNQASPPIEMGEFTAPPVDRRAQKRAAMKAMADLANWAATGGASAENFAIDESTRKEKAARKAAEVEAFRMSLGMADSQKS